MVTIWFLHIQIPLHRHEDELASFEYLKIRTKTEAVGLWVVLVENQSFTELWALFDDSVWSFVHLKMADMMKIGKYKANLPFTNWIGGS